jgi:glycosyltransferase involved in cell wall biosynthesis
VSGIDAEERIPLISVVVGVRNMKDTVCETIESIQACDYPKKEIIIVNDGSTDGTSERIRSRYPTVRLIDCPPNGISASRDVGWKAASGSIVAYTDADCQVSKDWLTRIAFHFYSDKTLAVLGGRTIFGVGTDIASKCRNVEFDLRYSKVPVDTVSAMGPNSAFRISFLQSCGGFNHNWKFGEDAQISYNISKLGGKIAFDKELVVNHVPEQGLRRYLKKRLRDAAAYVRVARAHPVIAFGGDKFITKNMIVQPFLFGLLVLSLIVSLFDGLLLLASVPIFVLLWFMNLPEALGVYKLNHKLKDFISALSLLFLRACIWGTGLMIGVSRVVLRQQ